ncbi:MAG: hypothetical protein ACI8S6_004352 [Myxococcota bacterium]|jgi:hypothetical protein
MTPIEQLHATVDLAASLLARQHRERMQCRRGCSGCCKDDLTVLEVEAARIRRHHAALLAEGVAGPVGGCAFLDAEGGCRVYAHRPYVCRTQGLPLRWIVKELAEDGGLDVYEYRDICPLNDETGPPLEELPPEELWTIGPTEEQLSALQPDGVRVPLRSLFSQSA